MEMQPSTNGHMGNVGLVKRCGISIDIWLVVHLPLWKNMSSSVGMMTFRIIIWINKSHVPNHQADIRLVKKFAPEGFIQRIMGLRYSSKYHWRRYALPGRVLAISHQKKNMLFCFGLEIPPHPGLLIIFQSTS